MRFRDPGRRVGVVARLLAVVALPALVLALARCQAEPMDAPREDIARIDQRIAESEQRQAEAVQRGDLAAANIEAARREEALKDAVASAARERERAAERERTLREELAAVDQRPDVVPAERERLAEKTMMASRDLEMTNERVFELQQRCEATSRERRELQEYLRDREGAKASVPKSAKPPVSPVKGGAEVSVWYATTRVQTGATDASHAFGDEIDPVFKNDPRPSNVHYGRCTVFVPVTRAPGEQGNTFVNKWITGFDESFVLRPELDRLTADGTMADIKAALGAIHLTDADAVVYVHGFNTPFRAAIVDAAQLHMDLRVHGITAVFSWHSHNSTSSYEADVQACRESFKSLAEFLRRISSDTGVARVHIVAHSMGNFALLLAAQQLSQTPGIKFGQIILAAPDVSPTEFRDLSAAYPILAAHTTMYVSQKDRALFLSTKENETDRAGYWLPWTVVPGVDTIDVTDCKQGFWGHSDFIKSPKVLSDMRRLIRFGKPPAEREGIVRATAVDGTDYWKIDPAFQKAVNE